MAEENGSPRPTPHVTEGQRSHKILTVDIGKGQKSEPTPPKSVSPMTSLPPTAQQSVEMAVAPPPPPPVQE
jgi:hypothetical protein